ncbi:MAG TPA: FAD-dependent oxidoreductase [Acidobacteriaceae bacterium]|nr:FAD-dependent oxidoreductase [Acidobacteriaceae bacterium]
MPRPTFTARLVQKACLSESAQCYHLEFAIDELPSFDYAAGQFISAVAPDSRGKSQTRAYSIASASNENHFDLCVNRVEGGFFSNHLCDMPEGGTVQVHGPHGNFTLRSPLTDGIFVATGTGIAPMRAFTQWLFPEQGKHAGEDRSEGREFWLIYGTRYENDLYYRDYFDRIAAEHENFHYLTTLSRAGEEWSGRRGYVQEYLGHIVENRRETAIESAAIIGAVAETTVAVEEMLATEPPTFDIHTYICGLNNMVSAVRERLGGFGWHKKQIIFERYD